MNSLTRPNDRTEDGTVCFARSGRLSYGTSIGILCLECNVPFVPGDVGNASTFSYPVRYELVSGASFDAVITEKDIGLLPTFEEVARRLEGQGVRAITGNCGYMATFQDGVAEAVDIPVFLSSLIQVPLVLKMLGSGRRLAILCANGESFDDQLLESAGVSAEEADRLIVRGLEDQPHWRESIIEDVGHIDVPAVEREVTDTAVRLQADDPSIGAFFLECSDLPTYGRSIQRATGLPVFDWVGFIDYVQHAVVTTAYDGFQ